ncbi:hypothetical protein GI374_06300 [Paracoccus sp. S-4012]|uniref:hypothetical protein n=1 Tax=Paracoccus sp. S-4012 TaxID=2665648 RepID=UPI0012AF9AEA|nr:hypothetical protein [Paracoccus sp. S-4012]MRX50069.1 hypothetical protein [Paracoccus sp. S-4012]
MSKITLGLAGLALAAVAGCTQGINPTDVDRAIIGAGTGYVVQQVRGESGSDRLKGAAIGAAGGVFCDDVGLCQ